VENVVFDRGTVKNTELKKGSSGGPVNANGNVEVHLVPQALGNVVPVLLS
jgi:hypothetical protein